MLGVAVGCMGMSYDGFCFLSPEEFSHIYSAYAEREMRLYRDGWERARMVGYMAVQPYLKKGMKPHGVLPLPWDEESRPRERGKATPVGKEETKKRFLKRLSMA